MRRGEWWGEIIYFVDKQVKKWWVGCVVERDNFFCRQFVVLR